jgi:O-antigen ligase/tetratricopeptide (TPR) repeat protein
VLGEFGLSFSEWPKTVFFRVLTEIIFVFYLLLIWKNPKYLPKISLLVLAVLIFIGFLGLSTLTSINPSRSLWGNLERSGGFITYLHFFVFFLILAGIFKEKKDWIFFLRTTVFVSFISSVAAFLQKFGVYSFYGNNLPSRLSGTLSNPDFFGSYLVLNLFLGMFLIFYEKKLITKIFFGGTFGLDLAALLLSGTRGAWVGFTAGVIFFVSFWLVRYSNNYPKARKAILGGALVLVLLFSFFVLFQEKLPFRENEIFERSLSLLKLDPPRGRLIAWQIALKTWRENPVSGRGLETLSFFSDKYLKSEYYKSIPEGLVFDRSHNVLIDLLASAGILGVLSYLFILFAVFYSIFKKNKEFGQIAGLALVTLFVACFVQNLFTFDTIATYVVFFLMLGFVNNCYGAEIKFIIKKEIVFFSKIKEFKNFLFVFIIFLSLISIYEINIRPTMACRFFIEGLNSESKDFNDSYLKFKKAINFHTIYDKEINMALAQHLIDVSEKGDRIALERRINDLLSDTKSFLERELGKPDMKYLFSHELVVRADERLYLSYHGGNFLQAMERISEKAVSFNGDIPTFWRFLGKVKIIEGKYEEGEKLFTKSFELGSRDIESEIIFYQNLGAAYYEADNKEKAAENFGKAADLIIFFRKFGPSPGISFKELSFVDDVAKIYLFDLQNPKATRKIYEKIIKVYPEYKDIFQRRLKYFGL